ncbi:DUF3710 domain-containing protein [Solihabitans fulvus]|uniref:DUF3710 domain-containing protein n=1 Tax=Solihabitans fulvus TaxID=1892852 RepID=A0A5B2WTN8_9PSEU|nr:DUF3710 domain-containing protein [Solihabitans fulvus]KAA2254945.1 DUF3710 domain-containing protein [Solihabitans fulvus]
MFGRRRKRGRHSANKELGRATAQQDEFGDDEAELETGGDGPYDEPEAPNDGLSRLDLGSIRVAVPEGAQLQVEMDPSGAVRAVHLITTGGQLTVSAFAAPKTGGLWREVSEELATQLRDDGAKVVRERGEWGDELSARANNAALRFVGVDGPRWMLRGVAAGPEELADSTADALRDLVRNTVVVRGNQPMPVRTPLPIELPDAIAKHIAQAQAEQG